MSNYVKMGSGGVKPGTNTVNIPEIDPNLSQEEKDLRLALALQQQENAIAYDAQKKRHDAQMSAQNSRTTRSNVGTRLPTFRKQQKDTEDVAVGGVGGSYAGPDGYSSDAKLAMEMQKVEDSTATTTRMIAEGNEQARTENRRNGRSVF